MCVRTKFLLLALLPALYRVISSAETAQIIEPAHVTESGPHHNVIEYTTREQDVSGNFVSVPHRYTQLESGLNRWDDVAQKYVPAPDEIEIVNGKGVARNAAHKVIFAGDADDQNGSIDMELPDKQRVRAQPVGIVFTELTTGRSMFVSELQSSGGIVDGKMVVYVNAFSELAALRYRMAKGSFEQDIILKRQLPDCTQAPFNMKAEDVAVEIWTQFLESPQPTM